MLYLVLTNLTDSASPSPTSGWIATCAKQTPAASARPVENRTLWTPAACRALTKVVTSRPAASKTRTLARPGIGIM